MFRWLWHWCSALLGCCALVAGGAAAQAQPHATTAAPTLLPQANLLQEPAPVDPHRGTLVRLPPVTDLASLPAAEPAEPAAAQLASFAMLEPKSGPNRSLEEAFGMLEKEWQGFFGKIQKQEAANPGKPSYQLGGQVQMDSVYFGQDEVSRESVGDLQDAADFRRARIVIQGTSHEVYRYVFGIDFALAGRPSYLDMYIEHIDLPILQNARVGHFFEPFSLERVTQNRNNTFMERSLVDTFAPARNLGAMTNGALENLRGTWQIGTFRTGSNDYGNDSFDSGQALTMRATCLPYWDEPSDGRYYVHVGAGYSYRDTYQNQVRFRNSPEIRIEEPGAPNNFGPIFVDTGNIPARNFQLFDGEFAWINGPFSVQSEYAFTNVDQRNGPLLFFDGFMLQLSYFLTGESRPYDRKLGIHTRMYPFTNFWRVPGQNGVCMGKGAWEVTARFSKIRLNDENIQGNNLTDFTCGLNWYWNAYTRVKFNYIRAFLYDTAFGKSATDIYGMRMDFEF